MMELLRFELQPVKSNIFKAPPRSSEKVFQKNPDTKYRVGPFEFETKIVWFNAIGFLFIHLIGLYGIYLGLIQIFNLQFATILWTAVVVIFGGEGITIGAHRYWSHKSFKATKPLQVLLLIAQTVAGQNCLYIWVRDHRQHHKFSDTNADPHNSQRGFFFCHMGWLMMKKHPDVIAAGKLVDMSDLEENWMVMFQKRYYKTLYMIFSMLIPIVVPIYFWNEDPWFAFIITIFSKYAILLNITWSVNSVAHFFGTRPYDKTLVPVESTFVSFISFGEGWHNYHHAFPWDYKASEFGMKFNLTARIIEFFEKIGWAYDLRKASDQVVEMRAKRLGDGTHHSIKSH